jgi:hypothetical protein
MYDFGGRKTKLYINIAVEHYLYDEKWPKKQTIYLYLIQYLYTDCIYYDL